MFAAANTRKESTSVTSKVYIVVDFFFFFLEKCDHQWQEPDVPTISKHNLGQVYLSWKKKAGKIQQPSSRKYGKGEAKAFSFSSWLTERISRGPDLKPNWSWSDMGMCQCTHWAVSVTPTQSCLDKIVRDASGLINAGRSKEIFGLSWHLISIRNWPSGQR